MDSMSLDRGGEPLRILVVSTWRSGSSFFGDLLQSHPGTLYVYEPLKHLSESRVSLALVANVAQSVLWFNPLLNELSPPRYAMDLWLLERSTRFESSLSVNMKSWVSQQCRLHDNELLSCRSVYA